MQYAVQRFSSYRTENGGELQLKRQVSDCCVEKYIMLLVGESRDTAIRSVGRRHTTLNWRYIRQQSGVHRSQAPKVFSIIIAVFHYKHKCVSVHMHRAESVK
jgi:hypothetical protein